MKNFNELDEHQCFRDKTGSTIMKLNDNEYIILKDKFGNIVTPFGTPKYSEFIDRKPTKKRHTHREWKNTFPYPGQFHKKNGKPKMFDATIGYANPVNIDRAKINTVELKRTGYIPRPAYLYESIEEVINFNDLTN